MAEQIGSGGHRSVGDLLATEGRLPVERAAAIAEGAGAALAALHTAGTAHGAINPGNLLIGDTGAVTLRAVDVTGPADPRADLHALGHVLYAMLTSGDPASTGQPSPRALRPDVPAELDELVQRMLAPRPEERPASATEVRAKLTAIRLASAPTALIPRTLPAPRHRKPAVPPAWLPHWVTGEWMRRWWISVVSTAVILVTAVTVTLVLTGRNRSEPASAAPVGVGVEVEITATPEEATAAPTTPPPSPKPAPTSAKPAGPIDLLAGYASAVEARMASGDLNEKAGKEILRTLGDVATAVRDGHSDKAVKRLRQLDRRLADLREDGKLSAAGHDALDVIDRIIATIR
ncbi:FIMAH domain-containing protein [Phytohabitans kaempferiae]|uniref:non-specific serine/threonine protein kinase n=1 Tax=Phytohabitans kaempferiae TaxID=1620943 RepID=A0ABV6M1Q2_9ACTN